MLEAIEASVSVFVCLRVAIVKELPGLSFHTLVQCFSTFFIMVHPKNLVTSSCTLCLKFEMRQNATSKLTCSKTIAQQSAQKITQYRAYNKFKKLSLMTFLL